MSTLANPYTNSAVTQAEPVRLVEMMYAGAIRFCRVAVRHITAGEIEPAHHAILRCYAIIAELMATLDFEQGGEVAVGLEQLYDFMLSRLKQADMAKDKAILDEVLRLLVPLHHTWCESFGLNQAAERQALPAQTDAAAEQARPTLNISEGSAARSPSQTEVPASAPVGGRLNLHG